ncbi:MAG: glycoside hydrolase family 3 N-terminal domain-containing protein, partial [Micropruina sp.]|uniref:glycoside hydrolase family 3 N-terminal domain-containing protein n=1 Tax=Micropruina sp. TaxID=2737536 RepID=UPI0039E541D2
MGSLSEQCERATEADFTGLGADTGLDLRRAVNATLMPGFSGLELPEWLAHELAEGLGGVCLFGSNIDHPAQVRALTDAIHAANPDAVVATDEEGGDVTRLHHRDGSPHPSMAYLGRLDDETLTEVVGASIGTELRAVGIDLNVAPDADVNSNPRNPVIGVRSFGADSALVARHVAAYTRGLQAAGVGAIAKHFPGHGDTATDSHVALPTLTADIATLDVRELPPFDAAVRAGTLAVMTSHLMVPAIDPEWPTTFSPAVLGELRCRSGFAGAIVSDALDMAGASASRGVPAAAVLALAAGVDLLCLGNDLNHAQLRLVRDEILRALAEGRLSADRVLEAAGRVGALASGVRRLRAAGAA